MMLHLPWPVSTNSYYRNVGRRTLISAQGRAYKKTVWALLREQRVLQLEGRIEVDVLLIMPDKRRRDIDNFGAKSLLDALEYGGAFKNDSQIDKLTITRGDVESPGAAIVTIRELQESETH